LLKIEKSTDVISIIHSVCSPLCQSYVEFYDTAWNKIQLQFNMPKAIQWINKEKLAAAGDLDKEWVAGTLKNSFISLRFDVANQLIVATNNSTDFLSDDDRKVILPVLNTQPIIFELNGRTWVQKP
jgi:hypothetical protein